MFRHFRHLQGAYTKISLKHPIKNFVTNVICCDVIVQYLLLYVIITYGGQLTEHLLMKSPTYHEGHFPFKFGMLVYDLYSVFVSVLHFQYGSKGPPSLLQNGYRLPFPGVRRWGRHVGQPPPSNAEVAESAELYIYHYATLLPSCHVTR